MMSGSAAPVSTPGREVAAWLHDEEFGWRGRIGAINPSTGVTFDHEWCRMLPRGVSFHVTRLRLTEGTAEALTAMADGAAEAAGHLATSRVQIVCYACTLGSAFQGQEGERRLSEKISQAAGTPAITMARACAEALRALGIRRVAIANPYPELPNRWIRVFLEASGITVAGMHRLDIADSWSITRLPPAAAREAGREALRRAGDADGIFISCGNLRTIEILELLEQETGRPVVSSNQALLWYALKILGIRDSIVGYGQLLSEGLKEDPRVSR